MKLVIEAGKDLEQPIRDAIAYYVNKLFKEDHIKNELDIEVQIMNKSLFIDSFECTGACYPLDGESRDPRVFTIEVEDGSIQEIQKALAHEMVHVKQYALNELSDYSNSSSNEVKWRGKKYKFNYREYFDYPWEIEAYGREVGLYNYYLRDSKAASVK